MLTGLDSKYKQSYENTIFSQLLLSLLCIGIVTKLDILIYLKKLHQNLRKKWFPLHMIMQFNSSFLNITYTIILQILVSSSILKYINDPN